MADADDILELRRYVDERVDGIASDVDKERAARGRVTDDLHFRLCALEHPRVEPPTYDEGRLRKEMHALCIDHAATKARLESALQSTKESFSDLARVVKDIVAEVGLPYAEGSAIASAVSALMKLRTEGHGRLMEEARRLRAENARLEKELSELLGTEFFKTGERLRRRDDDGLRSLLNDKRVFGGKLASAIEMIRIAFPYPPPGAVRALGDLSAWLFELAKWRDEHLLPVATEKIEQGDPVAWDGPGKLKRATPVLNSLKWEDLPKDWHLNPTSTED